MSDVIRNAWTWRGLVASENGPKSATTRHVLLTLSLYMSDKGDSCFPSVEELVRATGLSRQTVVTHISAAKDAGWVSVSKHGYGGQKWARNQYVATVPGGAEKAVNVVDHLHERQSTSSRKAVKEVDSNTHRPSSTLSLSNAREENFEDPVTLWRSVTGYSPVAYDLDRIRKTVNNIAAWSSVADQWVHEGYRPSNISGALDAYAERIKSTSDARSQTNTRPGAQLTVRQKGGESQQEWAERNGYL